MDSEVVRQVGPSNETPHTLHMLVTSACNLGCPDCFYGTSGYEGKMDVDQALKLVDEAAKMGVKWLAVGGGEPLLWLGLDRLIKHAHEHQLLVALTTNGTATRAVDADRIQISHDLMHAVTMPWGARQAQVLSAINYYKSCGITVGLNTRADEANALAPEVLRQVSNVTLVMPKPMPPRKLWYSRFTTAIEYCGMFTPVYTDSCLRVLMGYECAQGRTSLAVRYPVEGRTKLRYAACSNLPDMKEYGSLQKAWKAIRCHNDDLPKGCLVEGA
jgi:organic radical activating enzyme